MNEKGKERGISEKRRKQERTLKKTKQKRMGGGLQEENKSILF